MEEVKYNMERIKCTVVTYPVVGHWDINNDIVPTNYNNNTDTMSLLTLLNKWYNKNLYESIKCIWKDDNYQLIIDAKCVNQSGHMEIHITIKEKILSNNNIKRPKYNTVIRFCESEEIFIRCVPYINNLMLRLIRFVQQRKDEYLNDTVVIEEDNRPLCKEHEGLSIDWLICDMCNRAPSWQKTNV